MAAHTTSGNTFPGRTFTIQTENGQNTKTGRPYFFEWLQELPQDKAGRKFETRSSQNGPRHYELFAALDGKLVGIIKEQKTIAGDPEEWLILYLSDSYGDYKIEVGEMTGRYAMDIMKRLLDPTFDPSKNLRLSPYKMEKTSGGYNIGLSAYSGTDGKLESKMGSAHIQGCPEPTKTPHEGRILYGFTPVATWLWGQVSERVKLQKDPTIGQGPTATSAPSTGGRVEPDGDDLPF